MAISSGRSAFATRCRQTAGRGFPEPLGNGARSFLARRSQIAILPTGRRPARNPHRPRQSGWDEAERGAIRDAGGTGRQQGAPPPQGYSSPHRSSPWTCVAVCTPPVCAVGLQLPAISRPHRRPRQGRDFNQRGKKSPSSREGPKFPVPGAEWHLMEASENRSVLESRRPSILCSPWPSRNAAPITTTKLSDYLKPNSKCVFARWGGGREGG